MTASIALHSPHITSKSYFRWTFIKILHMNLIVLIMQETILLEWNCVMCVLTVYQQMSCPCRPFHGSVRLWLAGFEKTFHRSASRQDNGAKVRVAHIHTSTGDGVGVAGQAMVKPFLNLHDLAPFCLLLPAVHELWLRKKSTQEPLYIALQLLVWSWSLMRAFPNCLI